MWLIPSCLRRSVVQAEQCFMGRLKMQGNGTDACKVNDSVLHWSVILRSCKFSAAFFIADLSDLTFSYRVAQKVGTRFCKP